MRFGKRVSNCVSLIMNLVEFVVIFVLVAQALRENASSEGRTADSFIDFFLDPKADLIGFSLIKNLFECKEVVLIYECIFNWVLKT